MKRVLRILVVGAAVPLFSTALAWAQATAELAGRVTDESGAVLPGVTVTATPDWCTMPVSGSMSCSALVRSHAFGAAHPWAMATAPRTAASPM